MINGKFFSGLTEGMMRKDRKPQGVDRQRTNFFWPEEEQPDAANISPRRSSNNAASNNEYICKSRYKQQLTSKINFYDDTVDTPDDSRKVSNKRNNSDKNSKNDFYGYESNNYNKVDREDGKTNNKNNSGDSKTNGKIDENISRRDNAGMNGDYTQNLQRNQNPNSKFPVLENTESSNNDLNSVNGQFNDMKISKNNSSNINNNNSIFHNRNYEQTKTTTRSSHTNSNAVSKQQQQPRKTLSNGNKPRNNDNSNNYDSEFHKTRENNQQSRRINVVVEDTNNTNFMTTTNDTNRIIKSGRRSNYEEPDANAAYRKNRNERQGTQMGNAMYGFQTTEENRIDADNIEKHIPTRQYEKDSYPSQAPANRGLTRSLTIHGTGDSIPNEARQRAMSQLKSSIFFNDDTATATLDRRPASVRPARGNNDF